MNIKNTKLYQWWTSPGVKRYYIPILFWAIISGIWVLIPEREFKVWGFVAYGLLVATLMVSFLRYKKATLLSLILAASLLSMQAQAPTSNDDPKFLGCAVACVVLIVGAVVVYQLWSFCEAHLPPPPPPPATNNVPPYTNSIPTNFPAIYPLTNGPALSPNRQTFALTVDVLSDGLKLTAGGCWSPASPDSVSFDGWCQSYNQLYGTTPFPQPPAPANLQVGYAGGILSITEPTEATRTLILLRSPDMRHWQPVSTNVWSARFTRVMAVDMNAPQWLAFYKVEQQ